MNNLHDIPREYVAPKHGELWWSNTPHTPCITYDNNHDGHHYCPAVSLFLRVSLSDASRIVYCECYTCAAAQTPYHYLLLPDENEDYICPDCEHGNHPIAPNR